MMIENILLSLYQRLLFSTNHRPSLKFLFFSNPDGTGLTIAEATTQSHECNGAHGSFVVKMRDERQAEFGGGSTVT